MNAKDLIPLLLLLTSMPLNAEPALTIYNQNFAVVRENVPLDLKAGVTESRYSDMVSQLEPDSVILRDPSGKAKFQILEQNYRNDPITQELLLSLFEGKTIDFFIKESNKPDATVPGKIIRSGYKTNTQPVIEMNGKLQFSLPGQPIFPSLGDDTVLNPTLAWKIESPQSAKFDAELAYVTGGFSWEADYNIVSPEKGNLVDVVGWVTLKNASGKTFKDARVKLMAGDVNKFQPPKPRAVAYAMRAMAAEPMPAPPVSEKAFDEFHLYTLANKTTLRDQETKQIEFVRATAVKMERVYVYDGAQLGGWQVGMMLGSDPGYGTESGKKVAVYREFRNSQENNLGVPLPKGRVRFYAQDGSDQSLQFVGENSIDHTPKDELVRLYTGDSFDLVGERKRTDFKVNESNHSASESFEIKLRNRKKEPVEIRVVEHLFRWTNWDIKEKSHPFEKKDAQTVEFRIPLKPDQEQTVTYSVNYSW
ncbi:MAG: hypothetical protein NTX45_19510 [Proteobacteria bacterium]|nr:hypothetical protein [Pseudomonadota bacterium]